MVDKLGSSLHALTMPGDVMENQPFLDQFRRVLFRWKLHPDRVIADTKYSTIENIRRSMPWASRRTCHSATGSTRRSTSAPLTSPTILTQDVYRLSPRATILHPSRIEWKAEKTEYRADAAVCNACPLKAKCTPSDQVGRFIALS